MIERKTRTKILAGLLVVTFVTRIALAFRPEVKLTERPYQDDGYYALTCGYHLALGQGYSVDGVHPTNGVQPLLIPLYAMFFKMSGYDKWLGVRLTFILVALLDCFCVYALFRISIALRKNPAGSEESAFPYELIGPVLWTFLFQQILLTGCGLETGLYISFIFASIWCYATIRRSEATGMQVQGWRWMLFGMLLGLMVLARIDGVFIVLSLAATDMSLRKGRLPKRILPAFIFCSFALLVSSPWWIYNYSTFGSLMPISGQSEAIGDYLGLNIPISVNALINLILMCIPIPLIGGNFVAACILLIVLIAAGFILNHRIGWFHTLRMRYDLVPLVPVLLAGIVFISYYTFLFSAPQFLDRYFYPIRMACLILYILSVPVFWENLRPLFARSKAFKWTFGIFGGIALCLILAFQTATYVRDFNTPRYSTGYFAGKWALAHPNEKIGMTSSGTSGFVAENVVNLDGKVNFEALKARKKYMLGEYVANSGITVLIDWDYYAKIIIPQARRYGADFVRIDSIDGAGIYTRVSVPR